MHSLVASVQHQSSIMSCMIQYGLHMVQALEAHKTAQMPRVYYAWQDMLNNYPAGQVPYTPIIPLLHGLRASLDLLSSEGFENVVKRHHRYAPWPHLPLPFHSWSKHNRGSAFVEVIKILRLRCFRLGPHDPPALWPAGTSRPTLLRGLR